MTKTRKSIYWLPTIGYMALIFTLSSFSIKVPVIKVGMDKIIHVFEYAILVYLFAYSFNQTTKLPRYSIEIIAITATILYGIGDEFHQSFVPGRNFDVLDMVFDAVGASTIYLSRLKQNRKP